MSVLLKWLMVVATPLVLAQSPQKAELPFQQSQETALYASGQPTSLISEENAPASQNEPLPGVIEGVSESETGLEAYIRLSARDWGVDERLVLCLIEKESQFNPRALGDTHLTCPATGKPIRSRGILQINDCAWPEVSDETAFNFMSALEWGLPRIKETPEIWSTFSKCSNINP